MNRWMCSIILFGLCACAEPRHPNDTNVSSVSDLDAWRHFLLHQENFSKHGIITGVPLEVQAEALAFESELQQAVVACKLNGFMQDPNELVAMYRADVLAMPRGGRVEAIVLGRQKPHISMQEPEEGHDLYSFGNQFSTDMMAVSIVTDGYESNCYTYNQELRTQPMVLPSGLRLGYPDEIRFFPASN